MIIDIYFQSFSFITTIDIEIGHMEELKEIISRIAIEINYDGMEELKKPLLEELKKYNWFNRELDEDYNLTLHRDYTFKLEKKNRIDNTWVDVENE